MPVLRRGAATDRGGVDGVPAFGGGPDGPDPAVPLAPPPPGPAIPPVPIGGATANEDNPRDLASMQAPDVHRPTPPSAGGAAMQSGGGPVGAQPEASSPTPVASQPPAPFTPIVPPGGPGPASSSLYGSLGGLLGGGLGVPNALGSHSGGAPQSSVDIQRLLQLLGVGQGS